MLPISLLNNKQATYADCKGEVWKGEVWKQVLEGVWWESHQGQPRREAQPIWAGQSALG